MLTLKKYKGLGKVATSGLGKGMVYCRHVQTSALGPLNNLKKIIVFFKKFTKMFKKDRK